MILKRWDRGQVANVRIVITHMSRDTNRGDFAILAALSRLFKSARPEVEITAASVELEQAGLHEPLDTGLTRSLGCDVVGTPVPSRGNFHGSALWWALRLGQAEGVLWAAKMLGPRAFRMMPKNTWPFFDALAEADVVVAKGGSYLHVLGGWRDLIFLWRMLYPIRVARALEQEITLVGISIGEFEAPVANRLMRSALNGGVRVWVREEISLRRAREMLNIAPEMLRLIPDVAFSTEISDGLIRDARVGKAGRRIGVTVRLHRFSKQGRDTGRERYVGALTEALRQLLEDDESTTVIFIPQVSEDLPLARQVAGRIGIPARVEVIEAELDIGELLFIYSTLDLLIGARLHSVILAATVGVPAVHVIYEASKSYGTLELLGMSEFGIDYDRIDAVSLVALAERVLELQPKICEDLSARVGEMRAEIKDAVGLLLQATN
jgi:polysaccharide pyruvyl transferase WcaK-like protein